MAAESLRVSLSAMTEVPMMKPIPAAKEIPNSFGASVKGWYVLFKIPLDIMGDRTLTSGLVGLQPGARIVK